MKLLQYGDQHLRDKDIEEIEQCLNFIRDTAKEENVGLIVSCGDMFDSQDIKMGSGSARLAVKHISEMADIAPVAIVIGTPSHDGTAPEILNYARGKHMIFVASTPQQWLASCGCLVSLVPQPTKQYWQSQAGISGTDQEIGKAMSALFAGFGAQAANHPNIPHILCYHGGISGAKLPSGQVRTGMDIEVSTDQFMLANPDLVCCGHIHQPQKVGDNVYYSGPIYSTKVDEQQAGFYIHGLEVSDKTRGSVYIETPHNKTLRIQEDFTQSESDIQELDCVLYSYSREEIEGQIVRVEFKAWQDEAAILDKEKIKQFYLSAGAIDADVRVIRVPRENIRAEAVLRADGLPEKLRSVSDLRNEPISQSILEKARQLETIAPDMLLQEVAV